MRKYYSSIFTANLISVFLFLAVTAVNAQTVVINTGTAGAPAYNAGPVYRSSAGSAFDASRYTYLYTAAELSAAGITTGSVINIVGWTKNNTATTTGGGIFRIFMKNTAATSFANATETWANLNTGAILVYENLNQAIPSTITPAYITFPLSTPFIYSGGSLEISTEWDINQVAGNPSTGTFDWLWSTVTDRIYGTGQQVLADAGTLSSTTNSISAIDDRRPFIQITYGAGGPCVNPPVAGIVSASTSTACLGTPFTLSSTGGTNGTGQTYQWQISTDNVVWTNIPAAIGTSYTTTQTASNYYRLVVTCGIEANSNSVLVTTPAAVSGTFTINSLLPTGGTNFQSFNAAYDYVKCGIAGAVVFNVDAASGPYNEQLIMTPVPGASAANTVTFNGNGRTLSFNSTNTNERAVIKLNGADHIRFNDLVITAPGTLATEYGFAVHLINNADSNVINNCTINLNVTSTSTNYAGIVISASATSATTAGAALCDGNTFSGNTINGGYYGITVIGNTTSANQNTRIINNTISNFYQYGVYLLGNFNTLVDSNTISRPTRTTVVGFFGVFVTSLNVSVNITRNTITNPFGGAPTSTAIFNGIYFTSVDALAGLENKVINNLIYNLTGAGEVFGLHNIGSDNVWYIHNTISVDGTGGTGLSRGFYQTTLAAGIRVINNIVSITRAGTGAKYAIYYNLVTSDITSDNNDFYLASPTGNDFTGFYTTARATMLDWQTASGDDANSVATNPLFQDIALGNYRPQNASIDNLGAPENIVNDITGLVRSATTPDLGAFEFTPGNCIVPPTPGTATISQTPVCVNISVSLGVTGNSTGNGQTYQWQTATDIGGPFTFIGNVLTNPDTTITSSVTLYYRVAVTCSGNTAFSVPVLLQVNPALPAGTYTINAGAPASATNFVSFNAAKAAMFCGIAGPIVFNVAAGSGPYNEQLILDSIPGSSAINTITFNGNGNIIAYSGSVNDERAVIKFKGADFITFDSLTIDARGAGTVGYGVQLINNADSNNINNCILLINTTATTTNFGGIIVNASATAAITTGNTLCDGNTFSNNTITGGFYGITLVGSTAVSVSENKIINNTINDFYQYGIYLSGNFNTLVEANNISRPTRTVVTAFYGVYVTGLNASVDVSKNRIHNPFDAALASTTAFYGIYFNLVDALAGQENIVSNNIVYNINGAGAQHGLYNAGSDNVWYYHNSISLDDIANTATTLTYGFYQTTLASGIDLKNNIFSITRGGGANKFGIFLNTATSEIASNFNDIYVFGFNSFVGFDVVNLATLVQWQNATTRDLNSFSVNPFFINASAGNLRPQSPILDNTGTPIPGITTDIENDVRSATSPDMGAYEFIVPPCTAPPLGGNASAVPSSDICIGASVFLSLNGSSIGSGQTYQWQFSTTIAGPYTNLAGLMQFPDTTILATTTLYYRVAVTCNGNTQFSVPVLVSVNPAFPGGTYTINPANPPFYPAPGSSNFQSFNSAIAALECGISDAVTFDVAPGIYTEQVRMNAIGGTSPTKRVTFRSANGIAASVTLNYDAAVGVNNYVVRLDSARYITFRNLSIAALNDTGRVVELANTASYDSIVNCIITAPLSVSTVNTSAGIYADLLKGTNNVIKGNTIANGSSGIYFEGTSATSLAYDNIIDSNIVNTSYLNGIYIGFTGRMVVSNNTVNLSGPRAATNYGIQSNSSDSAYQYVSNKININGITAATTYGLYFTGCNALPSARGRIANNLVLGLTGNTGTLYGMYQTLSTYNNTVNNVISISSTGATTYASFVTGSGGINFHNNTLWNSSPSATANNIAGYFSQTSGTTPSINIQNNIFNHTGGGKAMFVTNLNFIYSDYNTFYTNGSTLINFNAANAYANLQQWINASYWDIHSIAIQPALISNSDPRPAVNNPDVWAIHGRGLQIPGNDYDYNNAPRPTTLTTGVPDMGAYEFLPTSIPTVLTGIPANPAPGTTQTFMYGTDTVAKITYAANAPVPASINLKRYSGVLPTGLTAGQQPMYFYNDIDVPAQGAYKYKLQQFYIDSWRGFIPTKPEIKMGRINAANVWEVSAASTNDTLANIITDTGLVHFDKYTGLAGIPNFALPPYTTVIDTSNRGTRFWVPYGHHWDFGTNVQNMWIYLSAQDSANVTVKINGTNWSRTYAIPANTVRVSDIIPKYGFYDARITDEGLFSRGISITSDVPIVSYAHIYNGSNSGASMLLPVGVYGYEYQSLNSAQFYTPGTVGAYSWFNVMTDRDSTMVEIIPSVTTKAGRPAGVPFTVMLMKGQVYNVMGTINGSAGTDLSGSKIKSIANASGKCYPIAVFSGSSRTSICGSSGDNLIQQVFPSQAWGKSYLTFATANSGSNTNYNSNIFRVMVKDPTTVVTKNGTVLPANTLVVPGNYYEFSTTSGSGANGAISVTSDKPVMVAQYMVSSGSTGCAGVTATGVGDPEMIYISPIEQGIKKAVFYSTDESAITSNYVNIVIKTTGLASLRIDGASVFTDVFAHPSLAGYSGVRHNLGGVAGQHIVESDSSFTAITYGLGSVESYGYNAGTLVKNLNALPNIVNTLGNGTPAEYTCINAPFRFNVFITVKPTILTWKFSAIPTLTPNADVIQNNPLPVDSAVINGRMFYKYTVDADYRFSTAGVFYVPILITDPVSIEGCNNTQEIILSVTTKEGLQGDFTTTFTGCLGAPTQFSGIGATADGVNITAWAWTFGDNISGAGQNISHTYQLPGIYNVNLNLVGADGCIGTVSKPVTVNALPAVALVSDSLVVCGTDVATFAISNPDPASTYDWFTQPTGGTSVFTGPSYSVPAFTGTVIYYVQSTNAASCISERKRVVAVRYPDLIMPVATADSIGVDRITFKWTAVAGATAYEVSIDNGANWISPSSGPTGLTHIVTGLLPVQTVSFQVRVIGTVSCQISTSVAVTAITLIDQIYIPNAFSPNGDQQNDIFKAYGYIIKSMRMIIFNQWGEKIFESTNQANGWNGTFRGKQQPSGVYMYVCEMILNDGSKLLKKGSVNLVR